VRTVVYALLIIVALLILKAMFVDDYLAERNAAETNATAAEPQTESKSDDKNFSSAESSKQSESDINKTGKKAPYSDMPLERAGNTIAETIGGKL
jgi:cytoskeletal protein RodZ